MSVQITPQIQNDPIINLPNLYKYGLVLSNDATNAATVLDISAGMCRDSNNVMDIVLGSSDVENEPPIPAPLLLDTTKNGLNGLDTGVLKAATMYAVYMIADSRYYAPTGAIMTLASNQKPLLPFGYDSIRLIGYWPVNDVVSLEQGVYTGIGNDMAFWYGGGDRQVLVGGNATTYTNVDVSEFIPPIDDLVITLLLDFTGPTPGDYFSLFNPNNSSPDYSQRCQVASIPIAGQATVTASLVMGIPSIKYIVQSSSDSLNLYINAFQVSV